MKRFLVLIFIAFILFPNNISATSGSLKKDTIKECEGNLYGQHGSDNHWHVAIKNENGSYSAKGDALEGDPCPINNDVKDNNVSKEELKNNDSSLKEITIDSELITIKDTMEYKTTKEKIDLKITPTDESAKVEYNKIDNLILGNNIININVTALDGTTSKYVLIIVCEKALSADTSLKVKIDNEEINFKEYKYNIEVKNNVKSLDLDYTLNDESAKVEIQGNEDFVTGKNEVKIIVTAENGESQEYIITVTKLDWFNSIIKIILGSSVVVAIVAFVKKIFKK